MFDSNILVFTSNIPENHREIYNSVIVYHIVYTYSYSVYTITYSE